MQFIQGQGLDQVIDELGRRPAPDRMPDENGDAGSGGPRWGRDQHPGHGIGDRPAQTGIWDEWPNRS